MTGRELLDIRAAQRAKNQDCKVMMFEPKRIKPKKKDGMTLGKIN